MVNPAGSVNLEGRAHSRRPLLPARRECHPLPMRKSHRALHPQLTLWLENSSGEPAFGKGRMIILDAIDAHGSLSAAARALDMSYRGLWARLRRSEKRLGFRLIVSHPGCGRNSGSALTPEGREMLERYRELLHRVQASAEEAAREILGGRGARPNQNSS